MKKIPTIFLICSLFTFEQFAQGAPKRGYVIEWGWNTAAETPVPAKLIVSNAIAISAGRLQYFALKGDGTVIAWNNNSQGEPTFDNTLLTSGNIYSNNMLVQKNITRIITNGVARINGQILSNVVSIAAGYGFGVCLKRDGTVVHKGVSPALKRIEIRRRCHNR